MDFRNRTHEEIRRSGGVGNLNEGIEISLHGLATRLIAWPGNGFQTQSVHVVTHRPGEESERYAYPLGEEAVLCLQGEGEVWLHERWVAVGAGDVAFWPPGVAHATRNALGAERDFVLVTQLTPPPFDLYEPAGFYDRVAGAMRFGVIEHARRAALPGSLALRSELRLRDSEPDVRAWNLELDDVRTRGALFNVYRGAQTGSVGSATLMVLWPGHGVRSSGLNFGPIEPGAPAPRHTHPISDECVVFLDGEPGDLELRGGRVRVQMHDVLLVPCGVEHGGGPMRDQGRLWVAGIASPPQPDLLLKSGYYDGVAVTTPPFGELRVPGWRAPRA
ncbi:cupin domain-containing protein [Conexibacter sp. CPCC 206217]|uniref:cupin domain-containing protein n=1 Tax=Conexibacter sp. CPCC 206217 TaxID=3064574 RepID=UPI00271DED78|nr:cupin domain-containing protein [Conexibacter sp. CPCC 206217]MDO8213500.1 cupin domain-containing protein [Conexibacter sp. CPCC 206217]